MCRQRRLRSAAAAARKVRPNGARSRSTCPSAKAICTSFRARNLTRQLAGVEFQLHDAADMSINQQQLAGLQLGDALLATLIVMLLVEQVLAYVASFHVRPAQGAKR